MKKLVSFASMAFLTVSLVVVFLTAPGVRAQGGEETLTNEDIVTMVKSGLSTIVVVNKIRTSKTRFNLTTNELIRLKQSGINDEIIQAMQGTSDSDARPQYSSSSSYSRPPSSESNDPNDPASRHEVGIYLYTEKGGVKHLTEMDPSTTTQSRTGGTFGTSISYGLLAAKIKARIPGKEANFSVTEGQPVFYFYLNEKDRTMAAVKYFPAAVSQFQLVRFKVKGKSREVTVGRSNAFGSRSGLNDDVIVDFSYEKVADGVYKITPKESMKNGEYGFYLLGTGESVGATFYDFQVSMRP